MSEKKAESKTRLLDHEKGALEEEGSTMQEKSILSESAKGPNEIAAPLPSGAILNFPKKPQIDPKVSDIATVATGKCLGLTLEKYQSMKKERGEKDIVVSDLRNQLLTESYSIALRVDRSLKGALVSGKGLLEEEKGTAGDQVDGELDVLRKSKAFKCTSLLTVGDAQYMTLAGEVKGQLTVSPSQVTFDPLLCKENKPLIKVCVEVMG